MESPTEEFERRKVVHHRLLRGIFYARVLRKTLPGSRRVLDAGCGFGDFLLTAGIEGKLAIGVDRNTRAVFACRHRGQDALVGDLYHLPFRDATFDAIFCSHVIEHVRDARGLLEEFRRVLRMRPGTLVIVTPEEHEHFWDETDHVHAYTPEELVKLLENEQFRVSYVCSDKAFMLGPALARIVERTLGWLPFPWAKGNIFAVAICHK